jgi:hypothetical protein
MSDVTRFHDHLARAEISMGEAWLLPIQRGGVLEELADLVDDLSGKQVSVPARLEPASGLREDKGLLADVRIGTGLQEAAKERDRDLVKVGQVAPKLVGNGLCLSIIEQVDRVRQGLAWQQAEQGPGMRFALCMLFPRELLAVAEETGDWNTGLSGDHTKEMRLAPGLIGAGTGIVHLEH